MAKHGPREYIGHRRVVNGVRERQFTFRTYAECHDISKKFGAGLTSLGVKPEDRVCIFSENRPEWILTIDASYLYGFTLVALYDTFTVDALEFSTQNSESKFIVLSGKNVRAFLEMSDDAIRQFSTVILLDPSPANLPRLTSLVATVLTFDETANRGSSLLVPFAKISPEQLCFICYSSGTTGFPKGVMISHRSFITNLLAIFRERAPTTFDCHLCYLPLCHVFERLCTSCVMHHGGQVGIFSNDLKLLTEDFMSLRPTVVITVPRVLQRVQDALNAQLAASLVKKSVFNVAWYVKRYLLAREWPTGIVDAIVFNKVRGMFGGRVTMMVNGGAALASDLNESLQVTLGWPIRPGYGLSEGGSGNVLVPPKLQLVKFGTCGYPLANVELRIEPVREFTDPGVGEILMGGTGLCSGYLNDPEGTAALFTDESHTWIHTGDIGKFDEDNSLVVVDRLRSIFKLAQGEYVAGDLLASFFEEGSLIEQCFVYGDSLRNFPIAIVVPSRPTAALVLGKEKLSDDEFAAACNDRQLVTAVRNQINDISAAKKLLGFQKIQRLALVPDVWTVDNGLLSPTFKAKRKLLAERYRAKIDQLYAAKE
jgi:long-chain acyl-CoA synthetase